MRLATFWQPSCFSCAKIFHITVIVGETGLTSQVIIGEKEHVSIQIFVNYLLRSQYLSSFFSACFVGTPWPLSRYSRERIQIVLSQKRAFFHFSDFIIESKNENLYCGAEYMTVLAPVASAKDSFKFHIMFCFQELYVIEL